MNYPFVNNAPTLVSAPILSAMVVFGNLMMKKCFHQQLVIEPPIFYLCRKTSLWPVLGILLILALFNLQFAKTILCQGHLCPLPLHVAPVYWPYDHSLRLYPLPDLVVCADKYDSFSVSQTDCTIINPVSFYLLYFHFLFFCFNVHFLWSRKLCALPAQLV